MMNTLRLIKHADKRVIATIALLAVAVTSAWYVAFARPTAPTPPTVPISSVVDRALRGEVERIVLLQGGNELTVAYKSGSVERSLKEPGNLLEFLRNTGVPQTNMPVIEVEQPENAGGKALGFIIMVLFAVPIVLLVVAVLARIFGGKAEEAQSTAGSGGRPNRGADPAGAAQFARSKARVITADRPSTTFTDVAGVEEAKEELTEVVDFLKRPDRYVAMGARIPKGLLMVGPPGTGKTLLARAVAGEAGVPFLSISGSEFVEMYVGVGAARVRDLFEQARKNAPCIVFVDEIDAVGRHRASGMGMNNDEREQTLNQLLVEMDGFDSSTNIIVMAATNRADVLDSALLRPGRFDRQVQLGLPDRKARTDILRVHANGKPLGEGIDLETVARLTPGFSGADLENVMNEAALLTVRRNAGAIEQGDLAEAIDRVTAGPRRKGRLMGERERRITAYHEAGHAVVAHALTHVDRVQKVTIVSRGSAGGYTRIVPAEDKYMFTRTEFKQTLAWSLGGQAAEQIVFGEMSTGAGNDIGRATQIARKMVTEYGMSERIGPVALVRGGGPAPFGRMYDPGDNGTLSNEVAYEVDLEVRSLLAEANRCAHDILTARRPSMERLAETLLEEETLEGERLLTLLGDEPSSDLPSKGAEEAMEPAHAGAAA